MIRLSPLSPAHLVGATVLAAGLGTAPAFAQAELEPAGHPMLVITVAVCMVLSVFFVIQGAVAWVQRTAIARERNEQGVAFLDYVRSTQPGETWQLFLLTTMLPLATAMLIELRRLTDLAKRVSDLSFTETARLFAAGLSPESPTLAVLYSGAYNVCLAIFVLMVTLSLAFMHVTRQHRWRNHLMASILVNFLAIFTVLSIVPAYDPQASIWLVGLVLSTGLVAYGSSFIAVLCALRYESFRSQPRETMAERQPELRQAVEPPSIPFKGSIAGSPMEAKLK